MTERILVVGAGAIGGVAAAHLTRAGTETVVLDANAEHVARMAGPGLLLEELDHHPSRIRIDAVTSADQLTGRFDFALVTVKSLALEAALRPLVERDVVDVYASFGNGLVQDVVESVVGRERLLVGLVEWGATNLGPGHLRQTTRAPMVVGELDGRSTERLERLVAVLRAIAPDSRSTSNIAGQVWSKLLLNSTFSGLGAAGGCVYRDVASHPVGREVAFRMWTEAYDVARELGLELGEVFGVHPDDLVVRNDDRAVADPALDRLMVRAGETRASMLQDLDRGLTTEVEVINGGVAGAARRAGVPAPLNEELTRILHEYERGQGAPGAHAFTRLAEVDASDAVAS